MISSPPVLYPDFYGINTPDQKDLIAAHMSLEEMRRYLDADTLNFLSIDGMVKRPACHETSSPCPASTASIRSASAGDTNRSSALTRW